MKDRLLDHATLLIACGKEMEALSNNPYSSGVNVKRLLSDLRGYADQLLELVKELPEDETEEPETAE